LFIPFFNGVDFSKQNQVTYFRMDSRLKNGLARRIVTLSRGSCGEQTLAPPPSLPAPSSSLPKDATGNCEVFSSPRLLMVDIRIEAGVYKGVAARLCG
jgi:hypothetical protein